MLTTALDQMRSLRLASIRKDSATKRNMLLDVMPLAKQSHVFHAVVGMVPVEMVDFQKPPTATSYATPSVAIKHSVAKRSEIAPVLGVIQTPASSVMEIQCVASSLMFPAHERLATPAAQHFNLCGDVRLTASFSVGSSSALTATELRHSSRDEWPANRDSALLTVERNITGDAFAASRKPNHMPESPFGFMVLEKGGDAK